MPAQFTPQQISKLAELIEPAFTPATLAFAVQGSLGKPLSHYSMGPTLPAIILDLVNKVNAQCEIDKLIGGLKLINAAPQLHAALDAFLAPSTGAAGPHQALLMGSQPPIAFVNRQKLRNHLLQVTTVGSGFRAISVAGPPACGKTYSKELIRFVAGRYGYHHVLIDVVDDTQTRSLRQVLEKISLGLGRPFGELTGLLPDDPTDARAAERFVDWLGGLSQGFVPSGLQYWLTFDGLDRPGAGPIKDTLIPYLLKAVADNNVRNVTLFLLGDNGKRVREASRSVLHEDASQLTVVEISQFFESYAAAKGLTIPPQDLTELVAHVAGGVSWPYDHKGMDVISEQLEKALSVI